ncbi:lycopene cyclase domain-containing protein [Halogeometricum borinquense]|uniref:lycopene cyclase domain-containing protein n=1 Tax=Halogeometricum borinquense TaxID=60847 RepID=UPI003433C527
MAISRHGTGATNAAKALASQVHPVFMLPPLASSLFGAALAGDISFGPAFVHVLAIFFAVYTAHVKDGLVDFYVRGEDDDHPMTKRGCVLGLVGAAVGFLCCLGYLWTAVGIGAAVVTLPTWVIGFLHAPQLDMNPVTATVGYPVGIALAIAGGYYVQTGALSPEPLAFASVFLVLLTGVKIIDDAKDYDYDASIDKRTVAVVLGPRRARRFAHSLFWAGLIAVLLLTVDGLFPPFAVVAALAFGLVALVTRRAGPKLATMLLVRGTYVFLALLVLAVWFRPLAGLSLPDIGVLGGYTYLATEVLFGAIALALLLRANAVRRAAVTIAAIYPVAYLWDWYTLEVGVFAIPLRTGIELFGIPLEEHLFMVVIPAFVIGVHEMLGQVRDDETGRAATDD